MTDPTAELFDRLDRLRHDIRLENAKGTVRFDLAHDSQTDHWLVAIDKGDVSVSRGKGEADCIVTTDKALFDRVAKGEENAIAAMLRADIGIHGDLMLLVMMERLLPGPPNTRGPRRVASGGRRPS